VVKTDEKGKIVDVQYVVEGDAELEDNEE